MKRTLDELALRYRLGGAAGRDIYVEGVQDKLILDHVFELAGVNATVYTADTVQIPNSLLIDRGLDAPSNRSIVVATREELVYRGVDVGDHIFMIDRDQEDLVATPCVQGCTVTDFGCLSAHLITERSLDKLARLIGRRRISRDALRASISAVSRELYVARAAAKRMGLPIRFLPPGHYVTTSSGGKYTLRLDDYLEACLRSVDLINRKLELLTIMETCRQELGQLSIDDRVFINDHEVWPVIRAILRDTGDAVNRSEYDIRDLFIMAVDERDLVESKLFRILLT